MKKLRYMFLLIFCLGVSACTTVEEVTVIHTPLIVPSTNSRVAPKPAASMTIKKDILQDIEEEGLPEKDSRSESGQVGNTENKALLTAINEWIGTRYQMGGCSKSGVDCSCFVKAVYEKAYGFELERSTNEIFAQGLTSVNMKNLQAGDLLFFRTKSGRIFHIGIYLKENKFAHVSRIKGVKISELDIFRNLLFSAKRLKPEISKITVDNMRLNYND